MKLPIQAQPVSRRVSSTMLAKKATNAVGASFGNACDGKEAECSWTFAACAPAVFGGPAGIAGCLAGIGAAGCFDCFMERLLSSPPTGPRQPIRDIM